MAKFVEGELAVLQNASYFAEWEGALALVVGGLALRYPLNMYTMDCEPMMTYRVRPLVEGAIYVNCQTYQLRKLDDRSDSSAENESASQLEFRGDQREFLESLEPGDKLEVILPR